MILFMEHFQTLEGTRTYPWLSFLLFLWCEEEERAARKRRRRRPSGGEMRLIHVRAT
jgi:hypothetical protein